LEYFPGRRGRGKEEEGGGGRGGEEEEGGGMSWEFSNFTRKFGNSYSSGGIKGLSREPKFNFSKICIIEILPSPTSP
jgi:hypothetical protein